MGSPNQIHLLPERDRMMAETHRQNADGSANPTGAATPQDAPAVHRGVVGEAVGEVVGKVVEAPSDAKPAGASTATTKVGGTRAKKKA